MKKAKLKTNKKIEKEELYSEGYSVKQMLIITAILLVIFGLFYLITTLVVKPAKEANTSSIVEIDSTKITANNLLNRKESEYYVLATKESLYSNGTGLSSINYAKLYNQYISDYQKDENTIKFYNINLDDAFNKSFIGDTTNITEDLSLLKFSDEVLFKIKDGKIENSYVGSSEIVKVLSSLKKS